MTMSSLRSSSRSPWRAAVLLAGGLLLASLTGCGGDADPGAEGDGPAAPTTEQAPEPTETAPPSPDATGSDVDVQCSGTTCSLTLSGDRQAEILGTTISLGGVQDGRATLAVGDAEVSCRQGERVSAGPLSLECTAVTADSVTLTASLG